MVGVFHNGRVRTKNPGIGKEVWGVSLEDKDIEEELWKDIPGYVGLYQVSTLGNVRSLTHTNSDGRCFKGKRLKPILQKTGYVRVHLSKYNQRELPFIHRLVAEAFIPNPNGYTEINHKDENPENNAVTNLEWCTHSYNINYGERNKKAGIKHRGEKCVFCKADRERSKMYKDLVF